MIRRYLFLAALSLAACEKAPVSSVAPPMPDAPAFPAKQPVAAAPPVQTVPYEDGYNQGYERGQADGKPRAKVPPESEIAPKAVEAAGSDPDRNEKWRNGWTSGYLDGFRKTAVGAK